MSTERVAMGVDFGGTRLKIGVVNSKGKIISRRILLTQQIKSPGDFLDLVKCQIQSLKDRRCIGVGIGLPGLVDSQQGIVHFLVNVQGWKGVPVSKILKNQIGLPVSIDNDVNLMTLGEAVFGAGRGCRNLVCLTLGTGVGGGILLEGNLFRGASLSAGEIGHMVLYPDGRQCKCGGRGCLEAYIGSQQIVALARSKLGHYQEGLLAEWIGKGEVLSPLLISRAARLGDKLSIQIWKEIGGYLGLALTSVVNLLNPERIIIGGGVAKAGAFLFDSVRKTIRDRALNISAKSVRVVMARLGENAGIVGAAVLAGITEGNPKITT